MTDREPRPALSGSAGLTLVELMIVLVIVSIGVLAIAAVQTRASKAVYATGQESRALNVGQTQVELARTAGFGLANSDSGQVQIFRWTSYVDSVAVGLQRVRVTVAWSEMGTPRTLRLNTLLSAR